MKLETSRVVVFAAALGLLGLAGLASSASAQCTDYLITQSSGASISPGTVDTTNHADDGTTAVALPFPVMLYGTSYNTAYVCSNGWLSFASTSGQGYSNPCLPGGTPAAFNAVPGPVLFPFWDDNYTADTANGEGVFSAINGVAPNRQFILEWRAVYCCTGGVPINNFEVILYEDGSGFDFVYGAMQDRGSATIGVQQDGVAGSHFTQFSCNTPQSLQGVRLHIGCGTGACCLVDGTCNLVDPGACAANGGLFGGINSACDPNCQRPGACCLPNGTCSLTSTALCGSASGTYGGDGVTCAAANCPLGGACCAAAGTCQVLTAALCAGANGLYQGDNSACSASLCIGRCCSPSSTCQVTSQQNCSAISGATYSAGIISCGGTYTLTQGTTAIEDISTTGAILISSAADNDGVALNPTSGSLDDGSTFFALPFTFTFYGNPYTQVNVGTNGYLTFDTVAANGNSYTSTTGIPGAGTPNNMIGAPWCDFYLFNAGHIGTQVDGVAPNRTAIIQWTGIQYYAGTGPQTATSTFQVILYETSNNVEIRIQTLGAGTSTTLEPHVLGVENSDGSSAVSIPNDTAAAGASYTFAYSSGCPTITTGSCCNSGGVCTVTAPGDCAAPSVFTAGGACPANACAGVCCKGSTCVQTTSDLCTGANTKFKGNQAACNVIGNRTTPCCEANYNQDGAKDVNDIFAYLGGWFSNSPFADIGGLGNGQVNNIFIYLGAWFARFANP